MRSESSTSRTSSLMEDDQCVQILNFAPDNQGGGDVDEQERKKNSLEEVLAAGVKDRKRDKDDRAQATHQRFIFIFSPLGGISTSFHFDPLRLANHKKLCKNRTGLELILFSDESEPYHESMA